MEKEKKIQGTIVLKKNLAAKITEEDADDIRMFHKAGISYADISKVYPLVAESISRITRGITWKLSLPR